MTCRGWTHPQRGGEAGDGGLQRHVQLEALSATVAAGPGRLGLGFSKAQPAGLSCVFTLEPGACWGRIVHVMQVQPSCVRSGSAFGVQAVVQFKPCCRGTPSGARVGGRKARPYDENISPLVL